jgi:flavin reductase (DIM6/NTAB) family NADH-FMN oxidoreductase RutF
MPFEAADVSQLLEEFRGCEAVITTGGDQFYVTAARPVSAVAGNANQVLVGVDMNDPTTTAIARAGAFAVTFVSDEQDQLTQTVAGVRNEAELDAGVLAAVTGAPIFAGGCAFLDCRVKNTMTVGNRICFVGDAVAAGKITGRTPRHPQDYPLSFSDDVHAAHMGLDPDLD